LYSVFALLVAAAMLLAACGGNPPPPPSPTGEATQPTQAPAEVPSAASAALSGLSGKVWQWVKTTYTDGKTIDVPMPAQYTLDFQADGKVAIKADCNSVSGMYQVDASNLTITLGPSTRVACPPASLADEYLRELSEVAQYQVEGETLSLHFKLDSGTMTFTTGGTQPAQPASIPGQDLGGKVWQWNKTTYNDGKTIDVPNPAGYTIEFSMNDGKVAIKADCNNATGEFMTDGQNLEIMLGALTRAMCPPESLSDEYLKELSEVGAYKVEGETLYLYFKMDSGTMTLTSGQAAAQPAPQPSAPSSGGAALSLEGPTWKWVKTAYNNGSVIAAPDPGKYTLTFSTAEGRFRFVSDCNNGSGAYTVSGQNLTMHVEGMTRAVCPPPSDEYIAQLNEVASYKIEGGTLLLMLKADSGTMTFTTGETAPATSPSGSSSGAATGSSLQRLTSGVWKWVKSIDNSGKDWTPANPDNYTVQFQAGGLVAIKADCNNASGTYTADETNLAITVGPMTLAACPPPSLGTEFIQQLGQAAFYFFEGSDLIIEWKMDSGSMRFTP
jgi:heat shock protein HslJ